MNHYLITGANRGLGLEFVRQLLARGERVTATCREPGKAKELAALACDRLAVLPLDVTDPAQIALLAKQVSEVDVLINNAGVAAEHETFGTFEAGTMARVLTINSIAPMLVTQAVAPRMGKGGKIVCITSGLGSIANSEGLTFGLSYGMSKAALNMGVKKLASEMEQRGIAIITLHPGWVQTDLGHSLGPAPTSRRG